MLFTSNQGNGHLVRLPLESRRRIAQNFVLAIDEFTRLVQRVLDLGPDAASKAGKWGSVEERFSLESTASPVGDSLERILFACRAGLDHARMAANALTDERAAFGVVTLTRGCVEAFAKGWWLMEASSKDDLVLRHLSGLLRECELRVRFDAEASVSSVTDGQESRLADLIERAQRDIESLSTGGAPLRVSDTRLASEFGDLLGPNGRGRYSKLSAVAHGESLGIRDFVGVTTGTRSEHLVVGLPAWLAEYCGETVFIASSTAMRLLIEFTGAEDLDSRAARAHDRALATMQTERYRNAAIVNRSINRFGRADVQPDARA